MTPATRPRGRSRPLLGRGSARRRWGAWLQEAVGWGREVLGRLYPEPPLCLVCRDERTTYRSEPLCPTCLEALPRWSGPLCEQCGQPTGSREGARTARGWTGPAGSRRSIALRLGPLFCHRCQEDPPPFARARAVAPYRGWVRAALHRLKYRGEAELSLPLGRLMGLLAREELASLTVSAVVPVPLHPDRLQERGYNQSELLAVQVSRALGRPLHPSVLERRRPTSPQVGLDEAARRRNLQGAFAVADASTVRRRTVLLVDDVLTTGATCREAARVLLEAGARRVDVLTLAATPPWEGLEPRAHRGRNGRVGSAWP